MSNKNTTPQTLKGFRDFLPQEKQARDFVMDKIITTFKSFGFQPLETPTLEYASLLLGKYGDEADKLVYSFTDRGDREIALRYDQTVPTARVLSQYQDKLPKYFRRYQVQNVFRADKPQKGRYREFTQCDIDIFNTTSPLSDAEIVACTYAVFKNLNFPTITIKVNDRQILFDTLKPFSSKSLSTLSLIQTIDKLDKKPESAVVEELISKGLSSAQAKEALLKINIAKPTKNLQQVLDYTAKLGVPQESIQFSPFLARGLDYYTGMIFEVIIPEYPVGSFGGGGRYDQLINQLGGPEIPAVGIAYGFDRIVEAAINLKLIPSKNSTSPVLITNLNQELSLEFANKLRQQNIAAELYPETDKLAKQLKYASQNNYSWLAIIGEDEANNNQVTLKNMETREQQTIPLDQAIKLLKK